MGYSIWDRKESDSTEQLNNNRVLIGFHRSGVCVLMGWTCPIPDDVNVEHLLKMGSASCGV